MVAPKVLHVALSTELIANHLYATSYVSIQTALHDYDLIPEAVYPTQIYSEVIVQYCLHLLFIICQYFCKLTKYRYACIDMIKVEQYIIEFAEDHPISSPADLYNSSKEIRGQYMQWSLVQLVSKETVVRVRRGLCKLPQKHPANRYFF